ncbi:MAG: iron-sulfur cluster assembly accessory protein [Verrucomicrobia bacterium]|nr:iron-sulfur cluster assembly accessory protein [Verrucomicrobiota bacterium]
METTQKTLQVDVTETAIEKLLGLGIDKEKFLRIGVIPGGCSGFTYDAVIDDSMEEGDLLVFESGDLRIVSHESNAPYVDGLAIDYSDDLVQAGFRLMNRNAVKSCGCGSSFATEEAPAEKSGGGCGSGCGC